MASRLDQISDWEERARRAGYRTNILARDVGVTRQQLNRYVHSHHGMAAHLWMERLRTEEARRLRQQGRLIKQIALEVGFRHATHFSRAFRRTCGIHPGDLPLIH